MRVIFAAMVVALGGCSLSVDYTGTYYACGENDSCPDGYVCQDQICIPTEPDPTTCSSAITAGARHSCMIRDTDGSVWCWGHNDEGQLGNNSTIDSTLPVQVEGLTGATSVVSGDEFSCAIIDGGAVTCWGANGSGQLGDGSTTGSRTPVATGNLTGVTQIAAGFDHACALASGGTVSCWGGNAAGQLGDGTMASRSQPSAIAGLTATQIAAGDDSTCAVVNKTLTCWGENSSGMFMNGTTDNTPTPIASSMVSDVQGVAIGGDHLCIYTTTGNVQCAGLDTHGELGDGRGGFQTTPSAVPVDAPIAGKVVSLTLGPDFSFAVDDAGGAWAWGNDDGRLAIEGFHDFVSRPTLTAYQNVATIAVGVEHTCARSKDGAIACAGFNHQGQLGRGSRTSQTSAIAVEGLANVKAITAGDAFTCALLGDGSVTCWGDGSAGQLGDGALHVRPVPAAAIATGIKTLVAGANHVCGITATDTLTCWGEGVSGQLGDGLQATRPTPLEVPGIAGVSQLAMSDEHTCVMTATQVSCWGENDQGQMGPMTGILPSPTTLTLAVDGPAKAIETAGNNTCVLDQLNEVQCFGANNVGQLGNDDTTSTSSSTGVKVKQKTDLTNLTGIEQIFGRSDDNYALRGGQIFGWGYGCDRKLGSDSDTCSATRTAVPVKDITNATKVAAGINHACALKSDGTVSCWGMNYLGQLGNGNYNETDPVPLVNLSGITDLAAGGEHMCALKSDKTVVCWGADYSGQLGDNVVEDVTPHFVRFACQ